MQLHTASYHMLTVTSPFSCVWTSAESLSSSVCRRYWQAIERQLVVLAAASVVLGFRCGAEGLCPESMLCCNCVELWCCAMADMKFSC